MSTRYISALLSPDHASSVLGIGLRVIEGYEQPIELCVVSTLELDSEVWPLASRQQLESELREAACGGQVDGTEAREPATQ
jgi:hypothetical protein